MDGSLCALMKTVGKIKTAKRGRPVKGATTEMVRISPRFPAHLAERLQCAADWRGVSVAAFIVEATMQRAEEVIQKETMLRFQEVEWKTINALLANPPKPTAHARKAAISAAKHITIRA